MSIKYLSSFIDALPPTSNGIDGFHSRLAPLPSAADSTASEDLKQILQDAKEGLEIKNTTHDFYETLERITNELRGMTEHSTAFLARVRKSDAPDYFNIIKEPMDLATVLKKVKAQAYKDKKAFKADLDLIWDNCLLYNTLPSHPLRKSAMILRNRANHLLEFVTDPVASTPAPPPGISSITSRYNRPGSRLAALDASHVVISTANILSKPNGFRRERSGSHMSRSQEPGLLEDITIKLDEAEDASVIDEFQESDEEEDESIRTRKGLTSHKSYPGGGRNLDLLKGLAAQDPSADLSGDDRSALSIYPSGIDSLDKRQVSSSPSNDTPVSTPVPPVTVPLPHLPGVEPGQGSALLAKRATGIVQPQRDRRTRARTSSVPASSSHTSFTERPALVRSTDMMTRYSDLASAAEDAKTDIGELYKQIFGQSSTSEATATTGMLSWSNLEYDVDGPSAFDFNHSASGTSSPLVPSSSNSASGPPPSDVAWYRAACSDALLSNVLPALPTNPCRRAKRTRSKKASISTNKFTEENPIWTDLVELRRLRRTHRKLALLRRETPGLPNDADLESDTEDDLSSAGATGPDRAKAIRRRSHPSHLMGSPTSQSHCHLAAKSMCTTLLEYTGFDAVHRNALDTLANLTIQYLSSLGRAASFQKERFGRQSGLGAILQRALQEVSTEDVAAGNRSAIGRLARYKDLELPLQSEKLTSLTHRVTSTYEREIAEAESQEPRLFLEGDVTTIPSLTGGYEDEDGFPAGNSDAYHLWRMLLEAEADLLGLDALQVTAETGFPLHLLHTSFLRSTYPGTSQDLARPFDPAPAYVSAEPLSPSDSPGSAVSASIGLLRPFLQRRSEGIYRLYDDDALPPAAQEEARKALATRPDVAHTTGRIVLSKRKRDPVANSTATASVGVGLNLTGAGAAAANNSTAQSVNGSAQKPGTAAEKAKKAKIATKDV